MNVPDAAACKAYAGQAATSWDLARVGQALAAERKAQARRCRVPDGDTGWPEDLAEALLRRVLRNMAMRNLPLGVQMDESGGITLGSSDPEIRRLEAPFRRVVLG